MASIRELHQQLIRKERSAVEITQETKPHYAVRASYTAFLCVTADRALSQARQWMPKSQMGRNRSSGWDSHRTICVRKEFPTAPHAYWRTLCRHMNQP